MNVLFVNACVRKNSRTHRLAEKVLQKLGGEVTEVDLQKENIQPFNEQTLAKRSELLAQNKYDDACFKYAHQFAQADIIVIAAPFWDLSFPASLKCYIEAVNVVGITFKYTAQGIQGLCKAQKLIYVSSAGGFIPKENCGYGYLKNLADILYGIPKTQFFCAEGLDIIGADVENIMRQSLEEIDKNL